GGFIEAAELVMARRARLGEPVSLLMFDLDNFKSINDRHGHLVGDEVLRLFAATVGTNMRDNDVVARLGGEEFVVMLPGTVSDAVAAAERVRLAFEAAGRTVRAHELAATVSVGAACGAPTANIAQLIGHADDALYRAKRHGRNRVESIDTTLPPAGAHAAPVTRPPVPARAA